MRGQRGSQLIIGFLPWLGWGHECSKSLVSIGSNHREKYSSLLSSFLDADGFKEKFQALDVLRPILSQRVKLIDIAELRHPHRQLYVASMHRVLQVLLALINTDSNN